MTERYDPLHECCGTSLLGPHRTDCSRIHGLLFQAAAAKRYVHEALATAQMNAASESMDRNSAIVVLPVIGEESPLSTASSLTLDVPAAAMPYDEGTKKD